MALPPPIYNDPDQIPFDQLVSRMTFSSTVEARCYAESHFQLAASYHADTICKKLIGVIHSSTNSDIRLTCAKWLRRLLSQYPPSNLCHWKNVLLQVLHIEQERLILDQIRQLVIYVARNLLPDNLWPEILSFIFLAILDKSARVPVSPLYLFAELSHLIKMSWLPPTKTLQASIQFYVTKCAGKGVDEDARNSTILACFALLNLNRERELLQGLLWDVLGVLQRAVDENQQHTTINAIKRLNNLIVVEPKSICDSLSKIVQILLNLAESNKPREDLKICTWNVIITLAKTREKEPVLIEQLLIVPHMEQFVAVLLEMLSDIDGESNFKIARIFSNSLSSALGGDLLVPVVIKPMQAFISEMNWKKRHAALFFLKEIAKGCCEAMKENLEQFVNMIVVSLGDHHPRVQGVALMALRVLLVDLKPDLEAEHFDTIFPTLIHQAISTSNQPHIQVEATKCAWSFVRSCPKEILKMCLIDLLDLLIHMILFTNNRVVEERALVILGSSIHLLEVHSCALQDMHDSDYRKIMDWLITFLSDAICCFDLEFCAKLVNCISTVGTVLGSLFRNDAREVMDLISSKCAAMEADDPARGYLLQSDSELIVSSTKYIDNNTGVKTDKGNGEKLLDEICHYADELKEDFYPWIGQVVLLLLPFLKIKFHKKVRKAAISAMSKLLRSAKLALENETPCVAVKQLGAKMITSLVEAMHEEDDKELCCEMVKCLVDCLQLKKIFTKATCLQPR